MPQASENGAWSDTSNHKSCDAAPAERENNYVRKLALGHNRPPPLEWRSRVPGKRYEPHGMGQRFAAPPQGPQRRQAAQAKSSVLHCF